MPPQLGSVVLGRNVDWEELSLILNTLLQSHQSSSVDVLHSNIVGECLFQSCQSLFVSLVCTETVEETRVGDATCTGSDLISLGEMSNQTKCEVNVSSGSGHLTNFLEHDLIGILDIVLPDALCNLSIAVDKMISPEHIHWCNIINSCKLDRQGGVSVK